MKDDHRKYIEKNFKSSDRYRLQLRPEGSCLEDIRKTRWENDPSKKNRIERGIRRFLELAQLPATYFVFAFIFFGIGKLFLLETPERGLDDVVTQSLLWLADFLFENGPTLLVISIAGIGMAYWAVESKYGSQWRYAADLFNIHIREDDPIKRKIFALNLMGDLLDMHLYAHETYQCWMVEWLEDLLKKDPPENPLPDSLRSDNPKHPYRKLLIEPHLTKSQVQKLISDELRRLRQLDSEKVTIEIFVEEYAEEFRSLPRAHKRVIGRLSEEERRKIVREELKDVLPRVIRRYNKCTSITVEAVEVEQHSPTHPTKNGATGTEKN